MQGNCEFWRISYPRISKPALSILHDISDSKECDRTPVEKA